MIGSVKAVARDDDAALSGFETLHGWECLPSHDASAIQSGAPSDSRTLRRRDKLRSATYTIEISVSAGPISTRPTIVFDYAPVDGKWVIIHAFGDFVLRMGPFAFGGSIDYRASEQSFPTSEPDYLFDKKQFAAYTKEQAGKAP